MRRLSRFQVSPECSFRERGKKTGPLGCATLRSSVPHVVERLNATEARPGLLLCHSASSSSFALGSLWYRCTATPGSSRRATISGTKGELPQIAQSDKSAVTRTNSGSHSSDKLTVPLDLTIRFHPEIERTEPRSRILHVPSAERKSTSP